MHVHLDKYASGNGTFTVPVSANMSFPKVINLVIGGKKANFTAPFGANIPAYSNLTIEELPELSIPEKLDQFSNAYITPISGMWSFLAGVAEVITPLIIRKKKGDKNYNKDK